MCSHVFRLWSNVYKIADYFAQQRTCTKCNFAEIREVKIKSN